MKKLKVTYTNNKKIIVISMFILFMILVMSFGFSAFSTSVSSQNITLKIRPDLDVRITSFKTSSFTNGAGASNVDYDVRSVMTNLSLPNSNSTATFEVTVKNYGNVEMGIPSITLPSNLNNVLDISLSGYTLGNKIRDNNDSCEGTTNGCKLSINRKFYITIKYDSGAYNSSNTNFNNLKLDFKFVQAYKITYSGFTSLSPTIDQKSALKGNTFTYNIGSFDGLSIKMGGTTITNYTYSGGVLTIPNVSGNIEVTCLYRYTVTTNVTTREYTMSSSFASNTCNGATSCSVLVPTGTSVKTTAKANYYNDNSITETVTASKKSGSITLSLKSLIEIGPYTTNNVSGYSINDLSDAGGHWEGNKNNNGERGWSSIAFDDRSVQWTFSPFSDVPSNASVQSMSIKVGIGNTFNNTNYSASSNVPGLTPTSGTCTNCDWDTGSREAATFTATPTASWLRSNNMTFTFTWKKKGLAVGYWYGISVWIKYRPV